MYRIIYHDDGQCNSWEFETRVFDTAHEAHTFALENYFDTPFHVVKICMVNEPTDYEMPRRLARKE